MATYPRPSGKRRLTVTASRTQAQNDEDIQFGTPSWSASYADTSSSESTPNGRQLASLMIKVSHESLTWSRQSPHWRTRPPECRRVMALLAWPTSIGVRAADLSQSFQPATRPDTRQSGDGGIATASRRVTADPIPADNRICRHSDRQARIDNAIGIAIGTVRRVWDLNPRTVSCRALSRRLHSAAMRTLPSRPATRAHRFSSDSRSTPTRPQVGPVRL